MSKQEQYFLCPSDLWLMNELNTYLNYSQNKPYIDAILF